MPISPLMWTEQESLHGFVEGFTRGFQQGSQQGFQEAALRELPGCIEVCLNIKFGSEGSSLLSEVYKIEDVNVLRAVLTGIRLAATLDDVRRIYT